MLASGQRDGALALYKEIADEDKGGIGAVARLRQAWALADTASRADLESLLAPLRDRRSAWKQWPTKFSPIAIITTTRSPRRRTKFDALANDPNSPQQLRRSRPGHGRIPEAGRRQGFRHRAAARADASARCHRRRAAPRGAGHCSGTSHAMIRVVPAPASRLRARGRPHACRLCSIWEGIGDTVGDWFAPNNKSKLRGERIPLTALDDALKPDAGADQAAPVTLPPPYRNPEWPQPGGFASNAVYHLEANGHLRAALGRGCGQGFGHHLAPHRLAGGGRRAYLYVLDSEAHVYAFDASNGQASLGQAAGAQERHRHAHAVGPSGQAQHHRAGDGHGWRHRL